MRLWHERLIPLLPKHQLLGQHRECCALRGRGWGRKHATVNYVFDHPPYLLYRYHVLVMEEMSARAYRVSPEWLDKDYRGKRLEAYVDLELVETGSPVYPEHDEDYLEDCLRNLEQKGIFLRL